MSTFLTEPDYLAPSASPDCGQPCGLDCGFAEALRSDPFAEEWLWCTHPANATRAVHPGRDCPRYAPAGSFARPA